MKGITLTTCAIRNHTLAAESLPAELHLFAWGPNTSSKGVIALGPQTRKRLPVLQQKRRFDRVALDYEHNTVPGTRAYKESKEPREVAAYGVPDLRPDGLWLTALEWTPSGRKHAQNFSDLSPAVEQDGAGEVVFLHSVALCRQGAVDGLRFYNINLETKTMDIKDLFAKMLGKKADGCSEQDIETGLDGLSPVMTALSAADPEKIKALLGLDAVKLAALSALDVEGLTALSALDGKTLTALSAVTDENGVVDAEKITALTTRLDALEADLNTGKRAAIVAQASREGKVIPLSQAQIDGMDITVLSEMVEKLEATVPIAQRTPENLKHLSVDGGDSELSKMAAACGYTMDDVKAANS